MRRERTTKGQLRFFNTRMWIRKKWHSHRDVERVLYLPNRVLSFFCRSVCSRLTFPPGEAAKVSSSFTYYIQKSQIEKIKGKKNQNAQQYMVGMENYIMKFGRKWNKILIQPNRVLEQRNKDRDLDENSRVFVRQ